MTRLVDRLLTRVGPELVLNRRNENKENGSTSEAATPAKPTNAGFKQHNKVESKNLALQLGAVVNQRHLEMSNNSPAAPNPAVPSGSSDHHLNNLLESGHAPESERSDAFSIPVSSGQNSTRHDFN